MGLTDDERARTRAPFFRQALIAFAREVNPVEAGCKYDLDDDLVLSSVYLFINRRYKEQRLIDPLFHNTKPTKIAALKMASVMAVRPFTADVESDMLFLMNPSFALFCAEAILGPVFPNEDRAHLRRMARLLDDMRFPSASTLLQDLARRTPRRLDEYEVQFADGELRTLDTLVTVCELVAQERPPDVPTPKANV